jgi:hypothetical protein
MDLPTELWEQILEKTRSIRTCDKLYEAFPNEIRVKLKSAYEIHKEQISLKMAVAFYEKISFYNGDHLMKDISF